MTMESFFDEYAHLYLIKQEENEAQYLLYESPPTYAYNWQWEADPDVCVCVLLRGRHNRIYHYDYTKKFPGKTYRQSVELPIDWLIYYDSVSRVLREPTETYPFKLFSVPYLILLDRTKRESHYYNSTAAFTKEDLIPSERMQITICHSPYTTQPSTNKINAKEKYIFAKCTTSLHFKLFLS